MRAVDVVPVGESLVQVNNRLENRRVALDGNGLGGTSRRKTEFKKHDFGVRSQQGRGQLMMMRVKLRGPSN